MNDLKQELGIEVPGEQKPTEVVESLAREFGWKSKEEFEADGLDPDHWVEPTEYIRREKKFRESLAATHEATKAELQQTRRTLDSLKNHYMKVRESVEKELKTELQQLREAKRQLISNNELERAMLVDDQIDALKEKHEERLETLKQEEQAVASNPNQVDGQLLREIQEITADWQKSNSWYKQDKDDPNTKLADKIAKAYVADNGVPANSTQWKALLKHMESEMREHKPNLFVTKSQQRGDRVDDGGGTHKGAGSDGVPKFTAEQEAIFQSFVDSGVKGSDGKPITRKQVYNEWKAMGAI